MGAAVHHIFFSTPSSLEGELLSLFPSYRRQCMNCSNVNPSHGMQLLMSCSSIGPSQRVQSFRNRVLQHRSLMGLILSLVKSYNNKANNSNNYNYFTLISRLNYLMFLQCILAKPKTTYLGFKANLFPYL